LAPIHPPAPSLTSLQSHQVVGHFTAPVLQLGHQGLLVGFSVVLVGDMSCLMSGIFTGLRI